MSTSTFEILMQKVAPKIQRKDTIFRQCISLQTRLLLNIRYLATAENFTSLDYSFRIGIWTVTTIITETIYEIYEVFKQDYLKTPQSGSQWKIEDGMHFRKAMDYENTNECTLERGSWRDNVFITKLEK